MGMQIVNAVGAKRELILPDTVRYQTKIVDHVRVRSYQKYTGQRYTTIHDTGNPRTNAAAEYQWLEGGRNGAGAGGYTFINDDREIIHTGVMNERTWAQGTPEGNQLSWATELAFGGAVNWNRALANCAAIHGAQIEMMDWDAVLAAVLHQKWYGKWCSAQILNRAIWPAFLEMIIKAARAARAYRNGVNVAGADPTFVTPSPPIVAGAIWDGSQDAIINGVKFEAQKAEGTVITDGLNARQWASAESLLTGTGYQKDQTVPLLGWVAGQLVDGVSEWWIDEDGSRLWAGGIDIEPKTDPVYGQIPEHAPGQKSVNGRVYYPLQDEDTGAIGRTLTIRQPGTLRRWATTESEAVGSIEPGTSEQPNDLVFDYWTRGEDIAGESIWVVQHVDGDVLHSGPRMWIGLTDERPN